MALPTVADTLLAESISAMVHRTVSPRQIERLREGGLIRLEGAPGRSDGRGRAPARYRPKMAQQGAAAVRLVGTVGSIDLAGAILFLRGWDVAPSALRRFYLAVIARFEGILELTDSELEQKLGDARQWRAPVTRSLVGALGSKRDASSFVEYMLLLFGGMKGADESPHPAVAELLGIEHEASHDHVGDAPTEILDRVSTWRSMWSQIRRAVEEADEAAWLRARETGAHSYRHAKATAALRRLSPRATDQPFARIESAFANDVGAAILLMYALLEGSEPSEHALLEVLQLEAWVAFLDAMPKAWREAADEQGVSVEPTPEQTEWMRRWLEENPRFAEQLVPAEDAG